MVAPGEASVVDSHYGGPRPTPRRSLRPRSVAEKPFCALGPAAVAFITGAASSGHTRLGPELAELATAFGRWRAGDVRSILAAGTGTAQPRPADDALVIDLPVNPGRLLSEYAPES